MLLSVAEVAVFAHVPTPAARPEDLHAPPERSRRAPASTTAGDVVLGANEHRGRSRAVWFQQATRLRHMHVIGATGTGKSTLLLSLIAQDLAAGRGVGLLDPHGDQAIKMANTIPSHLISRLLYFDPLDRKLKLIL